MLKNRLCTHRPNRKTLRLTPQQNSFFGNQTSNCTIEPRRSGFGSQKFGSILCQCYLVHKKGFTTASSITSRFGGFTIARLKKMSRRRRLCRYAGGQAYPGDFGTTN